MVQCPEIFQSQHLGLMFYVFEFQCAQVRFAHMCTYATYWVMTNDLRCVSIRKTVLPGMRISMLKVRRPNGRLIFNMEITIPR